jgi:hypothetical protein
VYKLSERIAISTKLCAGSQNYMLVHQNWRMNLRGGAKIDEQLCTGSRYEYALVRKIGISIGEAAPTLQ